MARCPQTLEFSWTDVPTTLLRKLNGQINPTERANKAGQKARNYCFHRLNVGRART